MFNLANEAFKKVITSNVDREFVDKAKSLVEELLSKVGKDSFDISEIEKWSAQILPLVKPESKNLVEEAIKAFKDKL